MTGPVIGPVRYPESMTYDFLRNQHETASGRVITDEELLQTTVDAVDPDAPPNWERRLVRTWLAGGI